MPLPLVVALELLPFVDWCTLLQLRATSRVCDTYEATQQLAYELQQRAEGLGRLAQFFGIQPGPSPPPTNLTQ